MTSDTANNQHTELCVLSQGNHQPDLLVEMSGKRKSKVEIRGQVVLNVERKNWVKVKETTDYLREEVLLKITLNLQLNGTLPKMEI